MKLGQVLKKEPGTRNSRMLACLVILGDEGDGYCLHLGLGNDIDWFVHRFRALHVPKHSTFEVGLREDKRCVISIS